MDFDLSEFFEGNENKIENDDLEQKAISVQSGPVILAEVDQIVSTMLDGSGLEGIDDDQILKLYPLLASIKNYQTIQMIQETEKKLQDETLTAQMYVYLFLVENDIPVSVACKALRIANGIPVLWRRTNALYRAAIDLTMEAKADNVEGIVYSQATNNPDAANERMFYLKRWKPEYKETAPIAGPGAVNLYITIDKQEFDNDQNFRVAGSDED